jgi:hypothetical protein
VSRNPVTYLMVVVLALQGIRLAAAVGTGNWSHLGDIISIVALATTVLITLKTAEIRIRAAKSEGGAE